MTGSNLHIAVIEHSDIIYEGLSNILLKSDHHIRLYRFEGLGELCGFPERDKLNIAIVNPSHIVSTRKHFLVVKKSLSGTRWIALLYSYFDKKVLSLFDANIEISDDPARIKETVCSMTADECGCVEQDASEELSDREKDVLTELVNGLSNKEIADKLFISTHTVASHRRNITGKTGIKSLSGLTIYAISKGIISLNDV